MFFIMELEIPLDQSEKMLVKLIVSIVLRLRSNLIPDATRSPQSLRGCSTHGCGMLGGWIILNRRAHQSSRHKYSDYI